MAKEMIKTTQGVSIMVLFFLSSIVIVNPGSESKQDIWIAILITLLLSIPTVLIYGRILSLFPGKDLFDILQFTFGKIPGKIVGFLYIWFAFHLGSMVIRNFSEFIKVVSLPMTPQLVVVVFIGFLCIWIVKSGIEVMGRWAYFLLPFSLLTIATVITLSLTAVNINNLKPVLYNGWGPVLSGAFSVFFFPFAETIVSTMIFSSTEGRFNIYKVYILAVLIGIAALSLIYLRNYLVLGELTSILYFPSYSAVSLIHIGFLQRIEIFISIVLIIGGIIKISSCLYAVSNGVAKIFNLESYRVFAAPIGFLMIDLSRFIFSSTMEMFEVDMKVNIPQKIPFAIVIPLIIWVIAEIKTCFGKRKIPSKR